MHEDSQNPNCQENLQMTKCRFDFELLQRQSPVSK